MDEVVHMLMADIFHTKDSNNESEWHVLIDVGIEVWGELHFHISMVYKSFFNNLLVKIPAIGNLSISFWILL